MCSMAFVISKGSFVVWARQARKPQDAPAVSHIYRPKLTTIYYSSILNYAKFSGCVLGFVSKNGRMSQSSTENEPRKPSTP